MPRCGTIWNAMVKSWSLMKETTGRRKEFQQEIIQSRPWERHSRLHSKVKKINLRFDDAEGDIVIENPLQKKVQIDRDLTALLVVIKFNLTERGRQFKIQAIINQLTSFNAYLIHCDLIDREENLFDGEFSDVISSFDIKGQPFKRVTYYLVRRNRDEKNKEHKSNHFHENKSDRWE